MAVSPYFSGNFRNYDLIKFLASKCDLFAKDVYGKTAYSYVLAHGHPELSKVFLKSIKSTKKIKKLKKTTSQSVEVLPSTVIHSTGIFKTKHKFMEDYKALVKRVEE